MIQRAQLKDLAYLKRLDMGFFLSILLLILPGTFLLVVFPNFASTPSLVLSVSSLSLLVAGYFQYKKRKIYRKFESIGTKRPELARLLSAVSQDLEGYSNLVTVNLEGLGEMISLVRNHLSELNEKIETMGKDLGKVYTVVSNLASQEVLLMEAVGKTSEEIGVMFEIVNAVIDEIQGRNKTMEELVTKSREGREKVINTSDTIQRISESSGGILKLIDFINNVSKETNLLAINASIEATHSGSEGKGFTVIAEEIRKLATQTALNSREITKLLRSNISDFAMASNATKDSGAAFEFIAHEIHVVHGTIAEVVQSISELKTRGNHILEKSRSLDEIATRVKDTSGEVYGEIITINGNLEETQTLSDKIQHECTEMNDSKDWLFRLTKQMQGKMSEIRKETDSYLKNLEDSNT